MRAGAAFAHRLVANGAAEDLALAEKVLDVVLGCQERRAHHGNFTWMLEDDHVEDLNAMAFDSLSTGSGCLECGPGPAWLFASSATGRYVAGYHGLRPAALTRTMPGDRVETPEMGVGTVVWDNSIPEAG